MQLEGTPIAAPPDSPWIRGQGWDLRWLIGSVAIVPAVLLWVWSGGSSAAINLGVTAVVGGPHLFATLTATWMDPRFRRSHLPALLALSTLVPAAVVWGTIHGFQLLLSFFMFAASLHVLQQNAFLAEVYARRAGRPEPRWSRLVDLALLFVSIYPIAAYKLVHGTFVLGDVPILIPSFLKVPATYWLVSIVFAALLAAWIAKTVDEHRRGVLNRPKTLLVGSTTAIAFLVPLAASGERLELAFQAVNAWHSIQYLALVWHVHEVRRARGLLESPFVRRMAGPGAASLRFYGFCAGVSALLLVGMISLARADPWGLSYGQYYYMGVLSCLLVHYALDAWLFAVAGRAGADPGRLPFAAAVEGGR